MVGFMNAEAFQRTRETGRVHFWSRSRAKLWKKGETSGHEQIVDELLVNCENNSLLVRVQQVGAVLPIQQEVLATELVEPTPQPRLGRERHQRQVDHPGGEAVQLRAEVRVASQR